MKRDEKEISAVPRDTATKPAEPMTLEPRGPGAGFGLKANWPGLVLIVLGGILLIAGAGCGGRNSRNSAALIKGAHYLQHYSLYVRPLIP